MELPADFLRSLDGLPGCDPRGLAAALDTAPEVSVRFNPYKIAEKPEGDQVPWCRYGFYLDERPSFTLDPAFHGGAYYVQEAGSMFIEHLMRAAFGQDGCEGLRVLDLCASPGGKTTLLSTLVGLEGVVVANEAIRQRVAPLIENAVKWGLGNVLVTHNDPAAFGAIRHAFDAVVVDAPCSGEGMMRKNDRARSEWSPANILLCAARQRRILSDAWDALRPGGVLLYSTCTFNRAENEENVAWMMEEFDCQGVEVATDPAWGIVRSEVTAADRTATVFRFYPGQARSEGFFAAALRKPEGKAREKLPPPRGIAILEASKKEAQELSRWTDQPEFMRFVRIGEDFFGFYAAQYPFIKQLSERLAVVYSGVGMGRLFHGVLKPEHALALFSGLSADAAPRAVLDRDQALAYLRRRDVDASLFTEGNNLACFDALPLGWAKRIGLRVNNLYPKESAIRM